MQLQKDQQDMGWTYLMVGKADKKAFFVPKLMIRIDLCVDLLIYVEL